MLIAMAPEQIVLFKSIVESYDNIATLRTEDPQLHHLRITSPRIRARSRSAARVIDRAVLDPPTELGRDLHSVIAAFHSPLSRQLKVKRSGALLDAPISIST